MPFKLSLILVVLSTILLSGCGSTIRQDGYVKHVNKLDLKKINDEALEFHLPTTDAITLLALHKNDSTAAQTNMLYAGDAGLIGLIAQVGAHAAFVSSERSNKLIEAQEQANKAIKPLLNITKLNSITNLIGTESEKIRFGEQNNGSNTFKIKPIFYSSQDMKSVFLKMIVWQELQTKKSKKNKYTYLNLIQVYGNPFSQIELDEITKGEDTILLSKLSEYLNQAMVLAEKDILGEYRNVKKASKTFLITQGHKNKVIRGQLLEKGCKFSIVKNLNSWLISLPHNEEVLTTQLALHECKSSQDLVNT